LILEVEAKKQLRPPLTNQQRVFLAEDLFDLNEPLRALQERARSVVLKNTFQTIAFEYWVDDLMVLKSDLMKIVDREIERRKAEFIFFSKHPPTDEQLMASGLENLRAWEASRRAQVLEDFTQGLVVRVARVRSYLRKLPDDRARHFWAKLIEMRIVVEDVNWRLILPFLSSHLLEDIEPLIGKEDSDAKHEA
jgi:hypothetical protein